MICIDDINWALNLWVSNNAEYNKIWFYFKHAFLEKSVKLYEFLNIVFNYYITD